MECKKLSYTPKQTVLDFLALPVNEIYFIVDFYHRSDQPVGDP